MEALILSTYIFSMVLAMIISYALLMSLLKELLVTNSVRLMTLFSVLTQGLTVIASYLYTAEFYEPSQVIASGLLAYGGLAKPATDALLVTAFFASLFTHYLLHRTRTDENKQHKALWSIAWAFTATIAALLLFMVTASLQ